MKIFAHHSGEYLQIEEAKIYYEVTGDQNSPALLILHGGFGNLEDFNTILPELDRNFRIIGIDSRGHGKSTLGSEALTYERIQNDVERVLEYLNIKTLSIIGFSDGGTVAYKLALLTSLNVENIVTIGSHWHINNTKPVREMFLTITGESWERKFPDTHDAYQELNPEPDFNFFTQSVIKMWLDSSSSGYPNEAVQNITCPLLIVRGDDDHLVSRSDVFELSERAKNSMLSRRQKAEGRRQKVKDTSCLVSGGRHFTFNYVHLLIKHSVSRTRRIRGANRNICDYLKQVSQ